jgi:hypothetical protein
LQSFVQKPFFAEFERASAGRFSNSAKNSFFLKRIFTSIWAMTIGVTHSL